MKALTEHKAPNPGAYEALMAMNSSLRNMSDFSGVRINIARAKVAPERAPGQPTRCGHQRIVWDWFYVRRPHCAGRNA